MVWVEKVTSKESDDSCNGFTMVEESEDRCCLSSSGTVGTEDMSGGTEIRHHTEASWGGLA